MEKKSRISPFVKQCFVTSAVGINIIGYGCAAGFPGILLPQLKDGSEIPLSREGESWIAAIFPLSTLIGNFIAFFILDSLGRKTTHYAVTIAALVGWFLTLLATSVEALVVGRTFFGISGGILVTLRSVLIGEYTSPKNRGAFLTTVSLTQAFGIFFVHLIGSLLSWQRSALICVFFPFISLIMVIYTPESPSWLISKGRYDECRAVFRWLRGPEEEDELEDMIKSRLAYEQSIIKEHNNDKQFRKLFTVIRKREFYKPIIIMMHSNTLMQVSGGTTMAAFSTVIIGLLMGPKANAHFWMVFLDTQRIICNAVAVYVINRTKRRIMVLSTGLLSIASHFAIAVYVYFRIQGWGYDAIWLPALLINLQFFAVAVGTVPMPQVIGGEVFPLEFRNIGGFICMITTGAFMFVILKTFPLLVDKSGLEGTFTIYGVILLYSLIIVMVLLPETKDKTLQQIEDVFRGRSMRLEELEAKQSLQSNPVKNYIRKMSETSCSSATMLG